MVLGGRAKQLRSLKSVLGVPPPAWATNEEYFPMQLPSCLYLWGPHNSGKSYIIRKALKASRIEHVARVSAVETLSGRRTFMESIIQQLNKSEGESRARCDDLQSFIQQLRAFPAKADPEPERIVLLVERTEMLCWEDPDLLYTLLNAQELSGHNLCVIFCSNFAWTSATLSLAEDKPIPVIHFPQYTKPQLMEILSAKPYPGEPKRVLEFYVNAVVNLHFAICRDVVKLGRLIKRHHPEFERCSNNYSLTDLRKIWKKLQPALKTDFRRINSNVIPPADEWKLSSKVEMINNQMPTSTKYILIAAFLASQNPIASDKRFFVKNRSARKLNRGAVALPPTTSKGPVQFTQARLQSIYSKLIGKPALMATSTFTQLTTLCNSNLIVRYDENLDDCKFRCVANLDLIRGISASCNFPLNEYLYSAL